MVLFFTNGNTPRRLGAAAVTPTVTAASFVQHRELAMGSPGGVAGSCYRTLPASSQAKVEYSFDTPVHEESMFYNLLTSYSVPKTVRIRSASLKIPYVILSVLLCCVIVCYTLIYKLEFLTAAPAYGMATVEAMPPLSNFWSCEDIDVDCRRFATTKMDGFCQRNSKSPEHFAGCQDVDFFSVTPSSTAASAVVPTSILEFEQVEEPFEDGSMIWTTKSTKVSYVPATELWLLKIRHSFQSVACTAGCNSDETQGFLFYPGDEQRRLTSCADLNITNQGCLTDLQQADSWKEIATCGDGDPGSPGMCVSTSWGDYITIGKLLEAANASLDLQSMADEAMTRRETGLAVIIEIRYSNDDPVDFWQFPSWPSKWGIKWKYQYRVSVVKEKGNSDHVVSRTIVSKDGKRRTVKKYVGITIRTELTSSLRRTSWMHALVALAVSASMLQLGSLVVENVLLRVYRCTAKGQELNAMFNYFARDEALELGHLMHLYKNGEIHRAKEEAELTHTVQQWEKEVSPQASVSSPWHASEASEEE